MVIDATALLAQPNDNYMDAVQLQFFKQLLMAKQSELTARIVGHEEAVSETEKVADSSDAGTIEENRGLLMRILKGERAEAMAIKAALLRIDEDAYGWCEDSGEPIGLRRLLHRPTANRTTEAQTRFERLGKHVRAQAV